MESYSYSNLTLPHMIIDMAFETTSWAVKLGQAKQRPGAYLIV